MVNMQSIKWLWYGIALALLIADQVTKQLVLVSFYEYERVELLPILDFTLVYNPGAAWSFLSDAGGWQRWLFIAISAVVSCVLVVWIHRLPAGKTLLVISLSLILGGALGNLYDRVMLGKVVDFILLHYQSWHFPAFNVADSAISVGALLMIIDIFREERNST